MSGSAPLRACESCDAPSQTQLKRDVVEAIKTVSQRLGNTPSVCRKCYVHPAVLDSYLAGSMPTILKKLNTKTSKSPTHDLSAEEAALMYLLQQQLAHAA
jgi:DNA topoisomerase-1